MKLIYLLFTTWICVGQNSDINTIRSHYNRINSEVESYDIEKIVDLYLSDDTEERSYVREKSDVYRLASVNMNRYKQDEAVVKCVVLMDGDRQNLRSEYYFVDQKLIFIFKSMTMYDLPKWDEKFDKEKKKIVENRYYFKNNRLIKWINEKRETVDLKTLKENPGAYLLHDAHVYQHYKEEEDE